MVVEACHQGGTLTGHSQLALPLDQSGLLFSRHSGMAADMQLEQAAGSPRGMLIEPGASGSLHMTLGEDLMLRSSLSAPLPDALLEPLWDSESGMQRNLCPARHKRACRLLPCADKRIVHACRCRQPGRARERLQPGGLCGAAAAA